ncbi:MAG: hypothetical protein IJ017_05715 [Oscillospiraceae bacterium]|nr:hypothetical protein [Oscillospiraceae bacterium]
MLFQTNEKFDLQRIPYARAGSYFYINEDYFQRKLKMILVYLDGMMHFGENALWMDVLENGETVRYNYFGDEGSLTLTTPNCYIGVALTDYNQVRFRGRKNAGLKLSLNPTGPNTPAGALKSAVKLPDGSYELYLGRLGYLRFKLLKGSVAVDCPWDSENNRYSRFEITFTPDESGEFEAVVHDYREQFTNEAGYPAFDEVVSKNLADYNAFAENYKKNIPAKYASLENSCIYTIWSHFMKEDGFIKSPLIMFHYNCIAGAFAWQQSYNGMAMMGNPSYGLALIESMFEYQDPVSGVVPSNVYNNAIGYAGVQPPLQGFAFNTLTKMCGEDFISAEEAKKFLPKFEAWVAWWTTYRTAGRDDDLIQINNPNESGWDDATIFSEGFPASNPDTISMIIECMYSCATLARISGDMDKAASWTGRADALLKILIEEFWDGEKFVTKHNGEVVESQSLAIYQSIFHGDKLPADIVDKCVEGIFKEGAYMTPMGLCSESMFSEMCSWRGGHFVIGRVVAPFQMYISVGLWLAGKKEEARKIAEAWCDTVMDKGVRLGFKPYEIHPLTGEPDPTIIEPQPSDSWAWAAWSACCTMTILQIVLGEDN